MGGIRAVSKIVAYFATDFFPCCMQRYFCEDFTAHTVRPTPFLQSLYVFTSPLNCPPLAGGAIQRQELRTATDSFAKAGHKQSAKRKVCFARIISGCSSNTELGKFWLVFLPGTDWCDLYYFNHTKGNSLPGLQIVCHVLNGWKFPLCAIELVLATSSLFCSVLVCAYQVLKVLPWLGIVQGFFVSRNFLAM